MGQIISNDPHSYLTPEPTQLNSQPKIKLCQLKTVPMLFVPYYDIVYKQENENKIEYVYKFLHNRYVSLCLTKKQDKQYTDSAHSTAGGEFLYGYKIKYRYKANDKIKNVLLKKRIYGEYQLIVDTLAQLKLLSILQVGPYIGTMINGSDAFIHKGYLEYYSQNLLNFKSNVGKLFNKLQANFGKVQKQKITNLGFSVSNHDIVLKPELNIQANRIQQQPLQTHLPISSLMPMTNSQNFKMSTIQDMITKQIKLIDEKTNNMSAIENSLIHKNIEKAINLYEQSLKKINNPNQKFKHIFKFIQLLSDSSYFKQYEQQIVTEALDDSQLESEHLLDGNCYRKQLEEKINILKLQSKQFSSESQIDQFSHTYSINDSDIKKSKLKINIQDSNNMRVKQIIGQMNKNTKTAETFNEQVSFQYALMLARSGKSRLALNCFELLLRSDKVSTHTKYKICSFMGLIYYHKSFYPLARKQFEKSISKILKMRYYSPALVLAYNNIGCAFYQQFKYEQSLQCYNCALSLLNWTNDYEGMIRNNRGITYLKLGMLKQAKQQFMVIINKGEPINNASILCKIYTNLGFMSMKSKQFGRAKDDLKMAIQIQQRCLIPNGHRPSPYLHNNMAMVRFKLKQFRQALDHFTKYMSQFQNLKSLEGVMVNYNIALAYKQCYKNQFATQHIQKCRRLLLNLPQKYKLLYEKKIQMQAESISRNNIDQVSDQSSGAVIDNMISTLTRKN